MGQKLSVAYPSSQKKKDINEPTHLTFLLRRTMVSVYQLVERPAANPLSFILIESNNNMRAAVFFCSLPPVLLAPKLTG